MKIHTLDLHFQGHNETIAAFLIENNTDLVLIETGPHSTFASLNAAVMSHGFNVKDIKHAFLSHIHFDHAGAAWALAQNGTTIYVHPAGEKHLMDPTKLYNSAKQIYQDQMSVLWGEMHGIAPENLRVVAHGEAFEVGTIRLKAWHTPGHAVHHIAWQVGDVLFTGDVAGCKIGTGIVMPPCPPPDINIEDWDASIALMDSLGVKSLYLTHYGEVTDVQNHLSELKKRLHEWAQWMKGRFDEGLKPDEITPQFQAYVKAELEAHGIFGEHQAQYESANPAWMSVTGLYRYWFKKTQA